MNIAISSARFNAAATHVPLADENDRLRAENSALRERIDLLERALKHDEIRIPTDWKLGRVEAAIVSALYAGGADFTCMSKLLVAARKAGGTSGLPETIRVHVSHIRRKLPVGCTIDRSPRRHRDVGEPSYRLNALAVAWLYVFQQGVS